MVLFFYQTKQQDAAFLPTDGGAGDSPRLTNLQFEEEATNEEIYNLETESQIEEYLYQQQIIQHQQDEELFSHIQHLNDEDMKIQQLMFEQNMVNLQQEMEEQQNLVNLQQEMGEQQNIMNMQQQAFDDMSLFKDSIQQHADMMDDTQEIHSFPDTFGEPEPRNPYDEPGTDLVVDTEYHHIVDDPFNAIQDDFEYLSNEDDPFEHYDPFDDHPFDNDVSILYDL